MEEFQQAICKCDKCGERYRNDLTFDKDTMTFTCKTCGAKFSLSRVENIYGIESILESLIDNLELDNVSLLKDIVERVYFEKNNTPSPEDEFEIEGSELKKYKGKRAKVIIPDGVTSIGEGAFNCCSSIRSIEIPNSVTSIGVSAFKKCSNLTSLKIPNGVTSIGYDTFWGCKSLESVEIPSSVTYIGGWAFLGCGSLTRIEISSTLTRICKNAFYSCSNLTIYCEASSKPSGWDTYWNPSDRPVVWGHKISIK